jgi:hypothetical protein
MIPLALFAPQPFAARPVAFPFGAERRAAGGLRNAIPRRGQAARHSLSTAVPGFRAWPCEPPAGPV